MHSLLLLVNVTVCAIILLHFVPNENGLANAIPAALNGGDALLLRKKRQDEDGAGDGEEGGGDGEEGGGDDAEGAQEDAEGGEDEEKADEDEAKEDGEGDDKEDKGEDEDGDSKDGKKGGDKGKGGKDKGKGGKGKEGQLGEGGGQSGNGGGNVPQPPGEGGGGTGPGDAICTDKGTGCEEGFCSNIEFARAHCAGTCKHVLQECSHLASVPDPAKSCTETAQNCGTIPDICTDDTLAVCGCAHTCNRCQHQASYMAQGRCKNVL